MGSGQSSKHTRANVEPISEDVHVERNIVITKPTSFTLPTNTCVSHKSYNFTDRKVQAVIFVEGPGVIRVGLTTTDPSLNQNILEGSVFEKEEGFDNKDGAHKRVLYRSEFGWFCFGKQDLESECTTDNIETNLWLYIIFVYGQPEVTCQVFYDDNSEECDVVIFSPLGEADAVDAVINKDIKSNTVVFKISDPISNGIIYRLQWDMLLQKEKIPGKSQSPQHGYMHLRLETNANENNKGVTMWERGSAVKDFPFSSVIAFRVSQAEKTVTHNLLVNSVGKTSTDRFTEDTGPAALYLTVEYSSGQIEITHSNVGLIRQEIGSILLVSDYNLEEGLRIADISLAIDSTTGFKPRRIQFGNTTSKFVVEFCQRLEEKLIRKMRQELRANIKTLSETSQVQVISVNKENIDDTYDLEEHFSRRTVGGGTLQGNITTDSSVPFCWIVNFEKERVARRVWLMKTHRIMAGKKDIKFIVLPYYTELGLATNYGEIPVFDRSPLVLKVDKHKLSYILVKEEKQKDFERSITKKINVHILYPDNKTSNSAADSDEESEEDEPSLYNKDETKDSLTFESRLSQDVTKHTIWKDICREEVQKYFEKFIFVRQISVDDSMWDKASEIMKTFGPECNIVCKENISDKSLLLIGSDLQTLEERARQVQSSLSLREDVWREISIIIESYIALDTEGKLHSIRSECPNTSMKVNRETKKVTFRGPLEEVDKAEREVLHLATNVRVVKIPLTQDVSIAIKTEKGRKFILEKIENNNLCTAFDILENKIRLHVYAQDKEEEERRKDEIQHALTDNVKCERIDLSAIGRQILQQPNLIRMIKTIEDKMSGSLVIVCDESIILYGTSEAVNVALPEVEDCIKTFKSDHVEINVSIDISKFFDRFRPYKDQLECMKDKNGSLTGKLCIHGKAKDVDEFTKTVRTEISEVKTHWFYLKKRWLARKVNEFPSMTILDTSEKFLVECEEGHTLASQGIISVAVLSNCGAVLQVRQGDITFETTDVIVNSVVGDQSSFDEGPTQYINYQGGGRIKSEFLQKLDKMSVSHRMAVGEMVTTGPGSLRCMQIVHVVPPNSKGGPTEEKQMADLVENILKTCDDLGMMSVSFPALGCGSRSDPIDKVTRIIVQVAAEYISKNKSKITEIILCESSKEAAGSFANAVDKLKGPWFVFRHKLDIQVENFMTSIERRAGGTQASRSTRGNELANQLSLQPEEDLTRPKTAGLRFRGKRPERQPTARTDDDDDLHDQGGHGNQISRRRNNEKIAYSPPSTYDCHSDVDDIVIIKVITKNKGKTIQQQIEQMVEEQYITKTISYMDLCKEHTLTQEEEKELKNLEVRFGLDVTIDKTAHSVTLAGLREMVDECQFEAMNLLQSEFPKRRRKIKNEAQVAEIEQWCYEQDGTVHSVDRSSNYELWHGHRLQKDFEYFNQTEQTEYSVRYMSIGQMEETPVTNPGKRRRLYISNQAETVTALPPQWTILKSKKNEAQVELGVQEIEYQNVRDEFRKSGCANRNIRKIIRLEHFFMWQQYQLKKKYLESINPQVEVEKRLWHGTSCETAQTIIKNGYDRGFAGQANAAAFGNGVYFAVQSSYSDGYARPDANGVKRMFLNRVLTGMYYQGQRNLSTLPERPGVNVQGINVCYDSAVDNMRTPTIYVIFHDTQVYPEYLIEYNI